MNRSRSNRRTRAIHFARLVAACSLCVLAAAAASAAPAAAPAAKHPLDPLTFQEYWTVLEVLHASGKVDSDTRFSIITLQEPAKDVVWRFDAAASGDTATTGAAADFPRRAFAVVRQKEKEWEAVVDLRQRAVVSFDALEGVQPNWLAEEFKSVAEEVKKNPEFIAAMKKRGIEDFTFIECGGGPPGYYGTREQKGRRIAHVACSDVRGVRNTWTRHVEGLTVVVDADTKEVLRVVDEGAVPMPSTLAEYDAASIGETREVKSPMHVDQPLGPGFDLDGNVVDWQGWRFHVRPDQRLGMVISTVTYRDGERRRPVLYQGSLSEIFVPYMDPAFTWYHRNFLDAGEYSAGGLTQPLMRGLDCPPHAVYLDGLVSGDDGRPH
ncbi:MAG TPA: hypothetical protein VHR17_00075, partial [Thermoanaerobaculia bacterium]|nr:hypothetical protein [Thermoanaerobaculia bacterium]